MKKISTIIFLVRGVVVEQTDADFTHEQIEQTKGCIANLRAVTYDEVGVHIKIREEEKKDTGNYYVLPHFKGLCYKAPNDYSIFQQVDAPTLAGGYDMTNEHDVNLFLDRLSFYLKQKSQDELDNFILIK